MGEDDVAALGALRLHDRREACKTAAALAVGHLLVAHLIDVVDQEEGDPRGFGEGAACEQDGGKTDEGGGKADGKFWHAMVCSGTGRRGGVARRGA